MQGFDFHNANNFVWNSGNFSTIIANVFAREVHGSVQYVSAVISKSTSHPHCDHRWSTASCSCQRFDPSTSTASSIGSVLSVSKAFASCRWFVLRPMPEKAFRRFCRSGFRLSAGLAAHVELSTRQLEQENMAAYVHECLNKRIWLRTFTKCTQSTKRWADRCGRACYLDPTLAVGKPLSGGETA